MITKICLHTAENEPSKVCRKWVVHHIICSRHLLRALPSSEYVELSREERLGPGGLDPVEVFESLPSDLQKCFETEDIPMLKRVCTHVHVHVFVCFPFDEE